MYNSMHICLQVSDLSYPSSEDRGRSHPRWAQPSASHGPPEATLGPDPI